MYRGFCCALEDAADTTFVSLADESQNPAIGIGARQALPFGRQSGSEGSTGLYRSPEPFSYGQVAGGQVYGTTDPSSWPVGQMPASACSPTNHGLLQIELELGLLATPLLSDPRRFTPGPDAQCGTGTIPGFSGVAAMPPPASLPTGPANAILAPQLLGSNTELQSSLGQFVSGTRTFIQADGIEVPNSQSLITEISVWW